MSVYFREEKYIKLLSEKEQTVKELSEKLFISEPTVRRDIVKLKEKEIVTCSRGVVKLKVRYADQRIPLFVRDMEYNEQKKEIAAKAAKYVADGNVVMMDASTTACALLPHLAKLANILVITNGAQTAIKAASLGIKVICSGGEMTPESFSYVGVDAEDTLRRYNADVAFFSCRGVTDDGNVTDNSILENSVRKIMICNSKRKYLLCDSTKLGKTCLNTLCNTEDLDGMITNER